ncbi:transcriptional regulator GcvA [Microbaculum marinum]|uniref:Transcriptional regulator GcvA n=1 Tax=Microbaculum marinum TaxID=1764581 RepID=A0AAW9RB89_9HYPH
MARIPPFNALRAFEVASRQLSFKRAAEELCVTQGAVSRHIQNLESHLGVVLFERSHRQVVLTPEGVRYANEIREALRRVQDATETIMASNNQRSLKVKVPPTFAIRWLVPRLAGFQARCPDMSLQISTPFNTTFFERDLDIAVNYPSPSMPDDVVCELMFEELLTPVVSPALAAGHLPIEVPDDLSHHVLLHSLTRTTDWRTWLKAADAQKVDPESGLRFENPGLVYQGATQGVGVAVGQLHFVTDDLLARRLIAPFRQLKCLETGYYLVFPRDRLKNPYVREFRSWILEEAEKSKALARGSFDWIQC